MPISKPISLSGGKWLVETSHGSKIFEDGETAYDFYLLNKHREDKELHGNLPKP